METSNTGKQILAGLKETRIFFEQVSLLMRTVDVQLFEKEWVNALKTNPKRSSDISSDLNQPQKWMPRMVSRLYINPDKNNIIVYAGVLLDAETAWKGFDEPWLTGGLFKYLPGKNVMDNPFIEWIDAHLVDEHNADGKFYRFSWKKADVGEDGEYYRSTMALPLIEFQSTDDLTTKIIEPLMNEINYAASIKPG
jgi:hypothetical protein